MAAEQPPTLRKQCLLHHKLILRVGDVPFWSTLLALEGGSESYGPRHNVSLCDAPLGDANIYAQPTGFVGLVSHYLLALLQPLLLVHTTAWLCPLVSALIWHLVRSIWIRIDQGMAI